MGVSPRAAFACRESPWPGHVRQLAHRVETAVIEARSAGAATVEEHHLFPDAERAGDERPLNFQAATRRFQRRYVLEALERNDWNVTETARQLELARSHVYNLINAFALRRR